MEQSDNQKSPGKGAHRRGDRDARLKAALKANMQKRKAQARARNSSGPKDGTASKTEQT